MSTESAELREGANKSASSRASVLGQLVVFLVLAAVLLPALSPVETVAHGAWVKLLFLARIVALLAVGTWFLHLQRSGWAAAGLRKPRWWKTLLAIPLGIVASAILAGVASAIVFRAGAHAADYSMFSPLRGNVGEYLFWAVAASWGTAAFGEELLFRGFVLQSVRVVLGDSGRLTTIAAIVVQAVIFGFLHLYQGPGGAENAGAIGLVLGFVWLFTERNLWAGIAIHGLLDLLAMTAIYLGVMPHH
jgi:membrane protease YdiL (CAAX protease family)